MRYNWFRSVDAKTGTNTRKEFRIVTKPLGVLFLPTIGFNMPLENKVAIVTGAATGIGQAIAVRLAREGAAVVVDYIGSSDVLNKTEEAIKNAGRETITVPASISDIETQPELEKPLMSEISLNPWGHPDEIAGLAVYLASDEASYVTGSTYFIDGGMLRQAGSY